MNALAEYIPGDSFIHRLNPLTKILWTFLMIILSFLFSSPLFLAGLVAANLMVADSCGLFKKALQVVRGLFIFSLFLVLFQIFFVTEGRTLFYVIPYFQMGGITDVGLKLSSVMALRMVATVSTIPILMMTTSMTDMMAVLVEKLNVPFKYTFMFTTALRFIPTFMREMEQILQAQMSRGYHADTKNPFKKIAVIVPLAVPLLVSSVKKTEQMAISMEVRGFASGPRSHFREITMGAADFVVLGSFALILAGAVLTTRVI